MEPTHAAEDRDPDEPTYWLNYNGDKRTLDHLVGPTTDGRMLRPVDAEYDPVADRTRVGFVDANPNLIGRNQ